MSRRSILISTRLALEGARDIGDDRLGLPGANRIKPVRVKTPRELDKLGPIEGPLEVFTADFDQFG